MRIRHKTRINLDQDSHAKKGNPGCSGAEPGEEVIIHKQRSAPKDASSDEMTWATLTVTREVGYHDSCHGRWDKPFLEPNARPQYVDARAI